MLKKVILLLAAVVVLSIAICGCSGNSGVGATGISLSEYSTIEFYAGNSVKLKSLRRNLHNNALHIIINHISHSLVNYD